MKELKFIHITKCAGTSIENIGYENNIHWGRFHKEYGYWHVKFVFKNEFLKKKYDWFVVVRNPYDRLISEFYCKYGGIGKFNNLLINKHFFNKFLYNKILNRSNVGDHYSEQYLYLDNCTTIHILKYENLESDFN